VGGMEVLSDKLRRFFRRQYRGELEWEAVAAVQVCNFLPINRIAYYSRKNSDL